MLVLYAAVELKFKFPWMMLLQIYKYYPNLVCWKSGGEGWMTIETVQ